MVQSEILWYNESGDKMLKIRNNEFQISTAELNLRSRNYQDQTIVSLQGIIGFYPRQFEDQIVSGTIEFTFDCSSLTSLSELSNTSFQDGKLELALSKDGLWDRQTFYDVSVHFGTRTGNKISVQMEVESTVLLEVELIILSLYTTSTTEAEFKKSFDMSDFYEHPIRKKIQNHEVLKYIAKAE